MQQSNLLNNLLNLKSPSVSANKPISRPYPARESASDQQDFQTVMSQTRAETVKPKPAAKIRQSQPAEPNQQKNRHKLDDSQQTHGTKPNNHSEKSHGKKLDTEAPGKRPVVAGSEDAHPPVSSGQVDIATDEQVTPDQLNVDEVVELQPVIDASGTSRVTEVESNPVIDVAETGELSFVTDKPASLLAEADGFALIGSETGAAKADKTTVTESESPLLAAMVPASLLVPGVEAEVSLTAVPLVDLSAPLEGGAAPLLSSGETKLSAPLSSIPATVSFRSPVSVPDMAASIVGDEPVSIDSPMPQTEDAETQDAETPISTMAGNIQRLKQALQKPAESLLPLQDKTPVADAAKPAAPVTSLVDALGRPQEQPLAATRSFMAQIQLPQTLGQPRWNQAVGERVLWMAAQNLTAADIRLDPPDLGTMHVKVTVQQDQASVTFVSQHQVVREALDQQATRLREMFAEQGLNLVHVDVSDRHAHERKVPDEEQSGGHKTKQGEEEELQVIGQTHPLNLRLVDHYA